MIELIVSLGVLALLIAIAFPSLTTLKRQLNVSEDTRVLATQLSLVRAEAIRLKTSVRVTFTTDGFRWDIGVDGSTDGSVTFNQGTGWSGSTPSAIVFSSLGLVRSLSTDLSLILRNGSTTLTVRLNRNGFINI